MKNFYDATVTRPNLTLEIVLRLTPVGCVKSQIQINDKKWITELSGHEHVFRHYVNINSPVDIQIQINRKHPEALEIALEIEGHTILPLYQERAKLSTCYINTNDIWHLNISNFYSWWHETTGQGWII